MLPEDPNDTCYCEEDLICAPCQARRDRQLIQAGLVVNAGLKKWADQISEALNASALMDDLLIDAIIQDRLERKPVRREPGQARRVA